MEVKKLLVEKYRPKCFSDLVMVEADKKAIISFLESGSIPSFIFHSISPGTGKSSLARVIISKLNCDLLKLNASDERGIDTIREKVSHFCKSQALNSEVKKCIFLDEADGLTSQAQQTLRNLMEEVSDSVFFILTANVINKIIDPLQSRCYCVDFNFPPKEHIFDRINEIIYQEELESETDVNKLISQLYPDIRRMIYSVQLLKENIAVKAVEDFDCYISILEALRTKPFSIVQDLFIQNNIILNDFITWAFTNINEIRLPDTRKGKLCEILCEMEKNIKLGIHPNLVMMAYIERLKSCLIY